MASSYFICRCGLNAFTLLGTTYLGIPKANGLDGEAHSTVTEDGRRVTVAVSHKENGVTEANGPDFYTEECDINERIVTVAMKYYAR